jgi:hypothetical protein
MGHIVSNHEHFQVQVFAFLPTLLNSTIGFHTCFALFLILHS